MKVISRQAVRVSRSEAAQLLRIARHAWRENSENAGEAIGWAATVLRDSRAARRMKIDWLLHTRQFDSADALLARALMTEAEQPLLRLRFARSMFEQGRIEQAQSEIQRVLRCRPDHIGALCLAARIASAQDQPQRAVEFLHRAALLRPHDLNVRAQLIEALLAANHISQAVSILEHWTQAPLALKARALRAQGRALDAIAILESDRSVASDASELRTHASATLLLELLNEVGAVNRIAQLTNTLAEAGQVAALVGAEALLGYGRFDESLEALTMLEKISGSSQRARELQGAALGLSGNSQPSPAVLQPELGRLTDQRPKIASIWLGGWIGRIINQHKDGRAAGADPNTSVLQPMLARAVEILEQSDCGSTSADPHHLNHLAICLQAMGRRDECAAVLWRVNQIKAAQAASPRQDTPAHRLKAA